MEHLNFAMLITEMLLNLWYLHLDHGFHWVLVVHVKQMKHWVLMAQKLLAHYDQAWVILVIVQHWE